MIKKIKFRQDDSLREKSYEENFGSNGSSLSLHFLLCLLNERNSAFTELSKVFFCERLVLVHMLNIYWNYHSIENLKPIRIFVSPHICDLFERRAP